MKSLTLSLALFLFLFVNINAQKYLAIKGTAHKQATVNILTKKQITPSKTVFKVPNKHWKPEEWSFDKLNIIFQEGKKNITKKAVSPRIISPVPDTSFAGLSDNGTSIPPDVNGAAGPDHLMQTLNPQVRITDKSGNDMFTTSLSSWWDPMPGNGGTFDPKIVFDPYQNRWIMITPSGSTSSTSRMYVGVSTTSNPLDDWNFYWFDTDTTDVLWFDYPNLGFNKKWISIGGIMRNSAFEAVEFVVFSLDKLAAVNGEDDISLNKFTTNIGSAIVPASTYDANNENLYLISTGDGNDNGSGYINLFKLSGTTDNPVFELEGSIGIVEPWENWSYENHGDFLPQMGSSEKLNSVDARMHTMIFRNDKLWAVHHIYLPADNPQYTAIQWWNLDTNGVILERGRIEDENQEFSYAFPSIAVNANEDVLIGHGVFSESIYASAGYSYKDHVDESGSMREVLIYKEGLSPYYKTYGGDRNRWGDYSSVSVDPEDDIDFWALHEYADVPSGSDKWGTWWAFLKPTFIPVVDFEADEILIPTGETIDFSDLTLGLPTNWEWTFEGGTPATSSSQNPQEILFDQEGSFDVTLIASNSLGSDTLTKENYITTSSTILPEVDFTSNKTAVCTGKEIKFTDLSEYSPINWEWQFDPSNVTFINGTTENSQNPEVIFNDAVSYSVTLTVWNLNGSSSTTKFDMISAGGYSIPYFETFEDESFKAEDWIIENPDESVTWEMQNIGGTLPGNKAMSVQFQDYLIGKYDRLITPPLNFSSAADLFLSLNHAYANKYDPISDSLNIYVSPDCGLSWEKVFTAGEDGNGSFATHELTNDFWPEVSSDWCGEGYGADCISLNIENWEFMYDIQIAFETYSSIGNPLFIDNILVGTVLNTEENITEGNDLIVFPNPSNGNISIKIPENMLVTELMLINKLGQIVVRKNIDAKLHLITIEDDNKRAKGTYLLVVKGPNITKNIKVILL